MALSQARTQAETARKRLENLRTFANEQALKAAAAQRDAARGRNESAQAQLSYSRITSPIDGVVTDLPFYPGETGPAGAAVVTVMDISRAIARTHVSQADAKQIAVGNDANLIGDNGVPIAAKVTQVSPALDAGEHDRRSLGRGRQQGRQAASRLQPARRDRREDGAERTGHSAGRRC